MRPQSTALGDEKNPRNIARWNERNARVLKNITHGSTMSNADQDNNMNNWKAQGTTPVAPNTDFTIKHSMGRVPITLDGWDTTNGGTIYRSPVTPWTKATATFRCTTASANYRLILI